MSHNTEGRVSVAQLGELLVRSGGRNGDWFTPDAVAAFTERPQGPIMPSDGSCLSCLKLPDHYGTRHDHHEENFVFDVLATKNGQPCIATVVDDAPVVVRMRVPEDVALMPPRREDEQKLCERDDEWFFKPTLLGVLADGRFVSHVDGTAANGDFFSTTGIYRGAECMTLVIRATVLRDGRLAYVQSRKENPFREWDVFVDGERVMLYGSDFPHCFFLTHDGQLLARVVPRERGMGSFVRPVTGEISDFWSQSHVNGRIVRDVVVTALGTRYIFQSDSSAASDRGPQVCALDSSVPMWRTTQDKIAVNYYLRGYTELGNGRVAYVGKKRLDGEKYQCWVYTSRSSMLGKEHIPFYRVSNLFSPVSSGNTRWYYYGALGQYLYLMELPQE